MYKNPITGGAVVAYTADGPPITKTLNPVDAKIIALSPRMVAVLRRLVPDEMTFNSAPGILEEARQILREIP